MGPKQFTSKEFSTLFVHIEALLNQRTLISFSDDLVDLESLTAEHFSAGESESIVSHLGGSVTSGSGEVPIFVSMGRYL